MLVLPALGHALLRCRPTADTTLAGNMLSPARICAGQKDAKCLNVTGGGQVTTPRSATCRADNATSAPDIRQQPSEQAWNSKTYQRDTGFVSELGRGVVEWLDPQKTERVLDLGCGDGVLTAELAQSCASVVGVDSSAAFVDAARERGLDARCIDAHALQFDSEFDAVFSNAALHWMLEPEKVVEGVARALRPGGRFVGEFGGFGNIAAVCTAMRAVAVGMRGDTRAAAPWYFPTEAEYGALLERHGFRIVKIVRFHRPTPMPAGMQAWLEVMRAPFFDQFGDQRQVALDRVIEALAPSLCDHQGMWHADYVRLRFHAEKVVS